tara:strand:- start:337 stop:1920 length:1584 start_codon:yes stop_codon:yes gene_type:complete
MNKIENQKALSIFDFDGTLVSINTPDIFCIWCTLKYFKIFNLAKILIFKLISLFFLRNKFNPKKAILMQLKGMSYFQLNKAADEFAKFIKIFKVKTTYDVLYEQLYKNSDLVISSASYSIYLQKIFRNPNIKVIGSSLEFKSGYFTGKLKNPDNIGEEKVNKLKKVYDLKDYNEINVLSDSESDCPLFRIATKRYFLVKNKSKKYNLFIYKIQAEKLNYCRNNIIFYLRNLNFKKLLLHFIPDFHFSILYTFKHSRIIPNILKPKSLNEKIIWLKLNDRRKWHHKYADKINIKLIIKKAVGEIYQVPTIKIFNDTEDFCMNINSIKPPYILKTNHDSAGGFIIRKKADLNITELANEFEKRINYNHYIWTREFQYKDIKPLIFAEKLLFNEKNEIPNDYKFNMINNKLSFVYCTIDRERANYRRIYDSNWQYKNMVWAPHGEHNSKKYNGPDIPRPKNFKLMKTIAEKLSKGFSYIRIDFYEVGDKVYVGELTQHHRSGVDKILPKKFDIELGRSLNLKKSNLNIPY